MCPLLEGKSLSDTIVVTYGNSKSAMLVGHGGGVTRREYGHLVTCLKLSQKECPDLLPA